MLAANVLINEIHYDPAFKTDRLEFVELLNAGDAAADLSAWRLSGAVEYEFPEDTQLPAGQFLVVAENPAELMARYGVSALGPFDGKLNNDGEQLLLTDAQGLMRDTVTYGAGFPWPTVGDDRDASIQLIHPELDNDLGGSWRSSGAITGAGQTLVEAGGVWRYFKGTQAPPSNWRETSFDDSSWSAGAGPVGYGKPFVATPLDDMRGNYTSVYLRQSFTVPDPSSISRLFLEAVYDDGINIWLNGSPIVRANVSSVNLPYTATASSAIENLEFVPFEISGSGLLQPGANVLAVQLLNASISGSSDAFIDVRLVGLDKVGKEATPGEANSVYSESAPPQIRQVRHAPDEPTTETEVVVTAKATDPQGVERMTLYYQLVRPGDYFSSDSARFESEWTTIEMRDDGKGPDAVAGDDTYSVTMPTALRVNRGLVRYRIEAEDGDGNAVRVPYADDGQPNFAYYVYDGVPDWTGAVRPGVTAQVTYPSEMLDSLPTYHLITTRQSHVDSQFIPNSARGSGYTGSEYLWRGTLVYDGVVYDHIEYRARGGVWRYSMGKNMWKFDFHRNHHFAAKNDYGQPYATTWDKLNFSAIIQQGDYLHRGEQGLFESVGFDLFNRVGVEAPYTHFIHFRIVEDDTEGGPNQYSTDFQGLYLVIEQPDGRMLDEHGLPDGNFYKMESGTGTLNNQGPNQPTDRSDLDLFLSTYQSSSPSAQWWQENLDLERYFSYRAIVEAIHHYDIAGGKNYFYFNNPETGKWQVHPWDLDLTWADNMFGSGDDPFKNRVAHNTAFVQQYRNRLREVLDLLYNAEQTGWLIDDKVRIIDSPTDPSWVDADRAMWDYNPILASSYVNSSKAGQGRYYQRVASRDFAGMVQLMKNYVQSRTNWINQNLLSDANQIPLRPVPQYLGAETYPINGLRFKGSTYSSPIGTGMAGLKWRIAEVSGPGIEGFDPNGPSTLEIDAVWESDVLNVDPNQEIVIPSSGLVAGKTYRVRLRYLDSAGRWSRWSLPVQFVAGAPEGASAEQLRFTELYYHPSDVTPGEASQLPGVTDEDFEYLELTNVSSGEIDLAGYEFSTGIIFDFDSMTDTHLGPGQSLVLASNPAALEVRFGSIARVAGPYQGRLENAGEQLQIVDGQGLAVLDVTYDDSAPWPTSADGDGDSLHLVDIDGDPNQAISWQAGPPSPGVFGEVPGATFVGAKVFYDGSAWDDFQAGLGGDADAIASDKSVLVAGQTAAFENVVTAPAGITGILVDVMGLPGGGIPSLDDFTFRVGTSAGIGSWTTAAGPQPLTAAHVMRGAGADGSDRIALVWDTGTLVNTWLEVTVLAAPRTGLAQPAVFYLASLVGDTGGDEATLVVNQADRDRIAQNTSWFLDPAAIDSVFDVNRDRLIDGSDLAAARDNQSSSLPRLIL